MTAQLTDDQIKPLIPKDMEWRYVVGEKGAIEFARMVIEEDRALQPPDGSWRFAIDQARIVNCLDCTTISDDPVKSLAELIQWEVQTALDPSVSSAAQALIDQGRAQREQAQPEPERKPVDYCTDPDNCRRCKTHPDCRGDMEHAGIGKKP